MNKSFLTAIFFVCLGLGLVACGGDSGTSNDNASDVGVVDKDISGVSQKGPFIKGSSVIAYELDGNKSLAQTGRTFGGEITSDDGKFSMSNVSLVSNYVRLEVDGYYRNEVTGKNSASPIKLNAYTDLSDRNSVNVNLLTHLEYFRVRELMASSDGTLKIKDAKKQAQREIFAAFGIDATGFGYSEDMDIFSEGEQNAALLAISILLQGDRTEAELTSLLSSIGQDIAEDGVWDDVETQVKMIAWVTQYDKEAYGTFRSNVEGWNLGPVPPFEKYLRLFWSVVSGLGVCGVDVPIGTIKHNWICVDEDIFRWRSVTRDDMDANFPLECNEKTKDTLMLGMLDRGNVYQCDGTAWKKTEYVSLYIGACSEKIQDSVVYWAGYYQCKENANGTLAWNLVQVENLVALKYGACDKQKKDSIVVFDKRYYQCIETLGVGGIVHRWKQVSKETDDFVRAVGACNEQKQDSVVFYDSGYYQCKETSGILDWQKLTEKDLIIMRHGECDEKMQDSVIIHDSTYYQCKVSTNGPPTWHKLTEKELVVMRYGKCDKQKQDTVVVYDSAYYQCQTNAWTEIETF